MTSPIDIKQRFLLANHIATAEFDITCPGGRWLKCEIPDQALFLVIYIFHHRECSIELNTQHRGVLIAISVFKQKILQKDTEVESVTNEILTNRSRTVFVVFPSHLNAVLSK